MRYVEARIDENNREEAYRIYVTNCLQNAPQGKYITKSWYDIMNPKKDDGKSAEEIAIDVISRAGLSFEVE